MDGLVAFPLTISQIVALVDDDQASATRKCGKFTDHFAQRDDSGTESVFVDVSLPHMAKLRWANDQDVAVIVLLHDLGHSGGHQGLAKAYDISKKHTPAPVQVVGRERDSFCLKIKEHPLKHLGQLEFALALVSLLREVIGHLEVDVTRQWQPLADPTGLD